MKRVIVKSLAVAFCFTAYVACGSVGVPWVDASGFVYDTPHGTVNQGGTATYLFELVVDMGTTVTDVGAMITAGQYQIGGVAGNGAADDVTIASWNNTWTPGAVGESGVSGPNADGSSTLDDQYAGKKFYFRFFDSSNGTENGAYAGLIYNTTVGTGAWVVPAVGASGAFSATLDRVGGDANTSGTTIAGTSNGWAATIATPEPATFALFGIGLVTMVIRRFRK